MWGPLPTLPSPTAKRWWVGLLVLAGAPGPAAGWDVHHNDVFHNNKACPGDEGPPISGVSVLLAGARNIRLHDNTVSNHAASGQSAASGGVVIGTLIPGLAPANTAIANNVAFGNRPFDIAYDGSGSGMTFANNHCDRSQPPGLCR